MADIRRGEKARLREYIKDLPSKQLIEMTRELPSIGYQGAFTKTGLLKLVSDLTTSEEAEQVAKLTRDWYKKAEGGFEGIVNDYMAGLPLSSQIWLEKYTDNWKPINRLRFIEEHNNILTQENYTEFLDAVHEYETRLGDEL